MTGHDEGAILVVDDDPDVRWAITDTIQITSGVCVTAGSAAEAVQIYNANDTIKIIITDLCMPVHDGDWLVSTIRDIAKGRNPPPVFIKMTGHLKERPDDWGGIGGDVVEFLVKPFSPNEIVDAIRRAWNFLDTR